MHILLNFYEIVSFWYLTIFDINLMILHLNWLSWPYFIELKAMSSVSIPFSSKSLRVILWHFGTKDKLSDILIFLEDITGFAGISLKMAIRDKMKTMKCWHLMWSLTAANIWSCLGGDWRRRRHNKKPIMKQSIALIKPMAHTYNESTVAGIACVHNRLISLFRYIP